MSAAAPGLREHRRAEASDSPAPATVERALPRVFRRFVRRRQLGLLLASIVIGAASGAVVAALAFVAHWLQVVLFQHGARLDLSAAPAIAPLRALLVPMLGGMAVAGTTILFARRLTAKLADAIEANALFGGRVSARGSLFIAGQTVLSNGFGGSVGLEAAFTQVCAALGSLFGRALAARRSDMRLLVGCGAAGAISAAFGAPLAGAFYAFEVVLGAYTAANFVPVVTSAVVAVLVIRNFSNYGYLLGNGLPTPVSVDLIAQVAGLSVMCGLASIVLMVGVSRIERAFSRFKQLPVPLRPVVGGALLGPLALATPVVLGSGHGALEVFLASNPGMTVIGLTIVLKMTASALSLGSGFRGGLFFASLLLGALLGQFYALATAGLGMGPALLPGTAAMAGMVAFGTGVLGAPVSMICLALELTGEFGVLVAAVVAASLSTVISRELFGYSFATWRFHLRGDDAVRGPHDVGWTKQISAETLMRRDHVSLRASATIREARLLLSERREKQFVVASDGGTYLGIVNAEDLNVLEEASDGPVRSLVRHEGTTLGPGMFIREVLASFSQAEADVLAVVEPGEPRRVLGLLSEAHVLRTYGRELERRNEEILFG